MTSSDAAVLGLIDNQQRILVCKRASHLRVHPGEACLPGGKVEEGDDTLVHTALREAHEEVGIDRDLIKVRYELDPINSLAGLWVHPVIGTVEDQPLLRINEEEVASVAWISLKSFLSSEDHWSGNHGKYTVHGFELPEMRVFGLTANLCILIAIKELGRAPDFDLNEELKLEEIASMDSEQIIRRFYDYYYENVKPAKEDRVRGKI